MSELTTEELLVQVTQALDLQSKRVRSVIALVLPDASEQKLTTEVWAKVERKLRNVLDPTDLSPLDLAAAEPTELYESSSNGPVRLITRAEKEKQHCAALLRQLLERAESGAFSEFAFAATGAQGDSEGHMVWTRSTNQQRLIGQVAVLESVLIQQIMLRKQ